MERKRLETGPIPTLYMVQDIWPRYGLKNDGVRRQVTIIFIFSFNNDFKELDRINAFVLLDLLGAENPTIAHQIGHGGHHLFKKLVEIGTSKNCDKVKMFVLEKHLNETNHLHKKEKVFHSFEIQGPIGDDHLPFRERRRFLDLMFGTINQF